MNDNGHATIPRTGPIHHDTHVLLWGVGVLFVLDVLSFVIPAGPELDAVRIDMLPVLIFGTVSALLSRPGIPAILPAGALAFASMIQAPFWLFTQEHCGAAVSNMVLAFFITPLLFASPLHVIPTLGASFVLAQWVLRRVQIITALVVSIAFIGLSAAAWWLVVLKMPGTGSCPNF